MMYISLWPRCYIFLPLWCIFLFDRGVIYSYLYDVYFSLTEVLYILTSMIYVSSGVMMVLATLSSSSQTACTSVDGSPVDGENHYGNHHMLLIFSIHCTILVPLVGRGRYSLPLPFGTKNTCRVTVCSHYHSDITLTIIKTTVFMIVNWDTYRTWCNIVYLFISLSSHPILDPHVYITVFDIHRITLTG